MRISDWSSDVCSSDLLSPILANRALGVCHFPSLYDAMDATQHLVTLGPTAVELVDSTMIELSRDIAMFRPVVDRFVRGAPGAILLVEFAEEDQQENLRRLAAVGDMLAQLGFRWGDAGKREGGEGEAVGAAVQIGRAAGGEGGGKYGWNRV